MYVDELLLLLLGLLEEELVLGLESCDFLASLTGSPFNDAPLATAWAEDVVVDGCSTLLLWEFGR